jgi:hypothetical protein
MSEKSWSNNDLIVENAWKSIPIKSLHEETTIKMKSGLQIGCFQSIEFGEKEITFFVPAFWETYLTGISKVRESCGTYRDLESGKVVSRPLGPVGYKLQTQVFKLTCDKEKLEEKILLRKQLTSNETMHCIISAALTFQQALKKGVCITLESELDDFDCHWTMDKEHVYFYAYDAFEGGSGLAKQIFIDWNSTKLILSNIKETLSSNCCLSFCEKCLLLPRTPDFVIRKGFLDKQNGLLLIT